LISSVIASIGLNGLCSILKRVPAHVKLVSKGLEAIVSIGIL